MSNNDDQRWQDKELGDFPLAAGNAGLAHQGRWENIEQLAFSKLLGVIISEDLKWDAHARGLHLHEKCVQRLYLLAMLKRAGITAKDILSVYVKAIIRSPSTLEYACQLWYPPLPTEQQDKLESTRRRALGTTYPSLL